MCFQFFFFFSSRRRHTRSKRDWSSDVCSSDLSVTKFLLPRVTKRRVAEIVTHHDRLGQHVVEAEELRDRARELRHLERVGRSEERRVGKECRGRWSRYQEKKRKRWN